MRRYRRRLERYNEAVFSLPKARAENKQEPEEKREEKRILPEEKAAESVFYNNTVNVSDADADLIARAVIKKLIEAAFEEGW